MVREGKVVGIITENDIVRRFVNVEFGKKVEDIMSKPFTIQPSARVGDCLRTLVNTRYRRLPVVRNGKLVGIVSSTDALRYLVSKKFDRRALEDLIERIMIRKTISVKKNEDVNVAVRKMVENDIGGLVVIDEEENVEGIVTERDVLNEVY